MGWKASTIIIQKPNQFDNKELLNQLGFEKLAKIEDAPFETAIYPKENKVYIGFYKNNLLICAQEIPFQFFEKKTSAIEKTMHRIFPSSEICAIVLQSSTNLWGYSVSQNGQRIRVRAGNSDDGTHLEMGEPLDEEKELLSKSTLNKVGQRFYVFDDVDDEPMTEDQVGENFVFAISKRYFGQELDRADDLLFDTVLEGYAFQAATITSAPKTETKSRKWLTYVIIFVLLVLWQIIKRFV